MIKIKKVKVQIVVSLFICILNVGCKGQGHQFDSAKKCITGAEQLEVYLPKLGTKKIAIVANQTSVIGKDHLVDVLLKKKVDIQLVFAPEHGFRGEAEAGEHVNSGIDKVTGIKVISLYGDHKKPTKMDLVGIETVVFDIQDVGVRFYTYISTLQYVMEACAENNIELVILDRPNPHGYYIDGPVLDTNFRSFVGMQPIPIVYALTIGEYANMLNGENWLRNSVKCKVDIVKLKNWNHTVKYNLPIPPSPNLPNQIAIDLYPSLCLFEGTIISVGRGTDKPFQVFGHPDFTFGNYSFTPKSIPGKSKNPMYEGKVCYGFNLTDFGKLLASNGGKIYLNWLMQSYQESKDKTTFFNSFFDKLAGNDVLKKQIMEGLNEDEIRNTWGEEIEKYKLIRRKYLLYKDFN